MSQSGFSCVLLSVALISIGACNKSDASQAYSQPAPAPHPAAAATATATATEQPTVSSGSSEARKIFKQRCSVCHGQDGRGDGPGAAALNPKPRNYTDSTWQKSVTDEHIAKTIVEGGAAVGKSPSMAPNPDLKNKPEVVKGLVEIVRSFEKD